MILNPELIIKMDTEDLYSIFEVLRQTKPDIEKSYNEEIKVIENGKILKIPIIYMIEKWYKELPNAKKVKIKGHESCLILEFYQEKRLRDTLLRAIIIENLDDEDITTPR